MSKSNNESNDQNMWRKSRSWNEYEWEDFFKENDKFANVYFKLLTRFKDIPDSEEVISKKMKDIFSGKTFSNLLADEQNEINENFDDLPDEDDFDENTFEDYQDVFLYETHPLYISLLQISVGWCNIFSSVLPVKLRAEGLKVLFYMGRALSNSASAIVGGDDATQSAKIALTKRTLASINKALGTLDELHTDKNNLSELFKSVKNQLKEAHDFAIDYLRDCKHQQ